VCSYSSVFFSFPPKIDHGSVVPSGDRDRCHCLWVCYHDNSKLYASILTKHSDETSPSAYRPISNLTVIYKLLERLVARQLMAYLYNHHNLPATHSGFRQGYSVHERGTVYRQLSAQPPHRLLPLKKT